MNFRKNNQEPPDMDLYYDTYIEYIEEFTDGNWDHEPHDPEKLARRLLDDLWCDDVVEVKGMEES